MKIVIKDTLYLCVFDE